jgi:hypothetical protein
MQKNSFELSVCVNGRPIREYGHRGNTYIEGRNSQAYTLRLKNNTAREVMAVISVDGIDVIDGLPATENSRGYIVPAYQSVEVKGWRSSLSTVNDFVFGTKSEAYSTQTQKTEVNCGVIGVKVYAEKEDREDRLAELIKMRNREEHHHHHHHYPPIHVPIYPKPWEPTWIYCGSTGTMCKSGDNLSNSIHSTSLSSGISNSSGLSNTAANSITFVNSDSATLSADFNLGTGWGKERTDEITTKPFQKGGEVVWMEIFYSDEAGLKKAGIEVSKEVALSEPTLPKSFHGFCKPPERTTT